MTEKQPATQKNNVLDLDDFLTSKTFKDYAFGLGGKKFQVPERNYIPQKSRDMRISKREVAIDLASQQLRHIKCCHDINCSYQWCSVFKSLLYHWKVCKERKINKKCSKCEIIIFLCLRSKGNYVAPPRIDNTTHTMPIPQTTTTTTTVHI